MPPVLSAPIVSRKRHESAMNRVMCMTSLPCVAFRHRDPERGRLIETVEIFRAKEVGKEGERAYKPKGLIVRSVVGGGPLAVLADKEVPLGLWSCTAPVKPDQRDRDEWSP